MKKDKWICVYWIDAHSNDNWCEKRDVAEWAEDSFKEENRTFGEIVEQNKDYIVLAASFSQHKNLVGDILVIPRVLIKKIKHFRF